MGGNLIRLLQSAFFFLCRSLYASTFLTNSRLPIGEWCLYSPAPDDNSLYAASSSSPIYNSQHYIMTMLAHARVRTEGFEILSAHHKATSGEIAVVPRMSLDLCIFAKKEGKPWLICYQYDSAWHYDMRGGVAASAATTTTSHEPWCEKYPEAPTPESCPAYRDSLKLAVWQKRAIETTFGKFYKIIYERESHCAFHNPYEFDGKMFGGPIEAARYAGRKYPDMNFVEEPFPRVMTLDFLKKRLRDKDPDAPCYRSGFICLSGKVPVGPHNLRIGSILAKRKIREEDLTPTFRRELKERIEMECPESSSDKLVSKFISELCKEPKLVSSNSIDTGVISLAYYDFLLRLGFKERKVHHILLFSLRSRRSGDAHVFPNYVSETTLRREALTRRIQHLQSELRRRGGGGGGEEERQIRLEIAKSQVFSNLIK